MCGLAEDNPVNNNTNIEILSGINGLISPSKFNLVGQAQPEEKYKCLLIVGVELGSQSSTLTSRPSATATRTITTTLDF